MASRVARGKVVQQNDGRTASSVGRLTQNAETFVAVSRYRLNKAERTGNFGDARNRLQRLRSCQNCSGGGARERQERSTVEGSRRRTMDCFIAAHLESYLS